MSFLCHLDEIPEPGSRSLDYRGISLFGVRHGGGFYVYRNRCPHLGLELNWQEHQFFDRDGMLLQCATHGALFVIESGECVAGPCLGERLQAIPVELRDGEVHLSEPAALGG